MQMCAKTKHAWIYTDKQLKIQEKRKFEFELELNSVHVSVELDFTKQTYQ